MADWVAWRCALDPRSAREQVRVARALARHATAAQLEKMLGAYRRLTREEADDAHERRYLHHVFDEDGCLRLNARLPAEQGALLLAALEAARASLRGQDEASSPCSATGSLEKGSAEPENQPEYHEQTSADALVAIAESSLAHGSTPLPGHARHQLTVHVDLDALGSDDAGSVYLREGSALAAETARRLGCEAGVVSVIEREGAILGVGRKTRAVPASLRRALELRDRGCRFPGCSNRRWTDAHHIEHWARGGETSRENLVLLCRRHHRLVHEGGYTVEGDPAAQLTFRNRHGRALANSPPLPRGDRLALRADSGPLLTGAGERMDLRSCVDAVFAACEPEAS